MGKKKKGKKVAKKKAAKRIVKKVVRRQSVKHEIAVRVEAVMAPTSKDLEPIQEKSKYFMPKTWMSEAQVIRLVQRTPPQHVYTRPGKGGQRWSYVTGNYVEKVLNFVFGWLWDFEIVSHGKESEQVWVLGKLSVHDGKGNTITKTQFGRADIKFKKDTKIMLDYGNDLKAAATDSLKKSASLLGIASDIYGKMEFKSETGAEVVPIVATSSKKPDITTIEINEKTGDMKMTAPTREKQVVRCQVGGEVITEQEAIYSIRMFKRPLCREHQPKRK